MDINGLVKKYEDDIDVYRSAKYNETQLRTDFLDPLFTILGWDITNANGKPTNEREVLVEEGLKAKKGANTKKPDYTFRLFSERKFFLEAKKPSVDVSTDPSPAKQVRRYGFTAKLKISVLSNFEYLAIYDCSAKIDESDPVQHSRIKIYHYTEYAEKLDEIYHLLSRENVYNGEFDKEWASIENKINRFSVDTLFLEQINDWRLNLAHNFVEIKPDISDLELNDLTQLYINSIVFLRVCEDRDLEEYETLFSFAEQQDYSSLITKLNDSDRKYNSGLFSLEYINEFISDKNSYIWTIIKQLYYPESTYSFSVFSSDILGSIYEIFLGEKISYVDGEIKIIPKAENVDRDIVTTPTHIIKDILRKTVVEYCKGKTDREILSSKFADIACGSGAFLLELFQIIQDILVDYYIENDRSKLQPITHCTFKLKYEIKQEILVSCIYGIDKDLNAVKASEFGLLLKLLEGEDNNTISIPALPKLENNLFYGNSLIESHLVKKEHLEEINPFDFNELRFDVVVGNPPYLATESIKQITPKELVIYNKTYSSAYKQYDKYFLFVERAINLLNDNGYFGYILPSKFMKVGAGKKLREYLSKNKLVSEIVSFGANQVFKNKTTYTCLLIAKKAELNEFSFVEVKDLDDWKVRSENDFNLGVVETKTLTSDTWILEKDTQDILNILTEKTDSLLDVLGEKTIENGIQTSANTVYIHKPTDENDQYIFFEYKDVGYQVEKELTRPYFQTGRGADSLYTYRNLIPNAFVIYPYRKVEGKVVLVEYDELKNNYPYLFSFLNIIRDKLDNDKRDIKPEPATANEWYRYGRSQSLENCDVPMKLVVGVLSNGYKYSVDTKSTFISSGGTAGYCPVNVPSNCKYSIFYIQALLSSKYLEWFASIYGEIFRGGFVARGTKVLKRMPIVTIDFDNADSKKLHDDISNLQQELNQTFGKYEKNAGNARAAIPLKRKFDRLKLTMKEKLIELFDLGDLDDKIPSIAEIYNKEND
ncbi:adenine methyltransferase [Shewanella colwelliana]|uniref:site-specific DNA-methyltransferase (adenine-specific) n=1 Tax=Shewanella colwelliana TaxID=23 RepID=A0A1E5IUH7_SHECO|nr:N-6 DNA methylase [Shewanella colwelliana]OEG74146.1 adenine methyltransferase [Shewanella colwelliana]